MSQTKERTDGLTSQDVLEMQERAYLQAQTEYERKVAESRVRIMLWVKKLSDDEIDEYITKLAERSEHLKVN